MKKANPKLILSVWKEHIADNYKHEIVKGNIDFFLNKELYFRYRRCRTMQNIYLKKLDILREPIKKLGTG